jgi:hypothetical protein
MLDNPVCNEMHVQEKVGLFMGDGPSIFPIAEFEKFARFSIGYSSSWFSQRDDVKKTW